MNKRDFDAVVVGSGPNGLAAAITLQQQGLSVLLLEGAETMGGGMRSAALTLPGFIHDACSAIHPMAIASPFFNTLPLQAHGLNYLFSPLAAAHPFDDGTAAELQPSLAGTAAGLGIDQQNYLGLMQPLIAAWPKLLPELLAPLHLPRHPLLMAAFGKKALRSAESISKLFVSEKAKGLWAGLAAHAVQPFSGFSSSAIGLVLMAIAHTSGWPIVEGGSQMLANALIDYFISLGGKTTTGFYVDGLQRLPSSHVVLFDVSPRQLLDIAGHRLSALYRWQLNRYRYGMGAFKIDWALEGPIPFTAAPCREAATVHLGGSFSAIAASEQESADGKISGDPFVLLAQPSLFDASRAPAGKHTAWAYCHVPNGLTSDRTAAIEKQVERFAPGFCERILARHVMDPAALQASNPNYIGGDFNGGSLDIGQLFTRPALRFSPYRSSVKGIYLCSASTPPGGGVHGLCGYHAARRALKDEFGIRLHAVPGRHVPA